MRNGRLFIVVGILFGGLAWLVDAVVDWLFFSGGTFWEALITDVPAHDFCMRLITVAAFVVLGVLVSAASSRQKRAEQTLRKSEERFRTMCEQTAVGIAHMAPNGRFLWVNPRFCEIVGYTREEMLARTFQDITHPDDLETDCNFVDSLLAGQMSSYSMEKRYYHKNGSVVWVSLTVASVRDVSGSPKNFISVVEETTARKEAERKQAEKALRLIQFSLDHCGDAVFWIDPGGRFVNVNETACRWLGYSRDQMLAMRLHEVEPSQPAERWSKHFDAMRQRRTASHESHLRAKDGHVFPIEISANFVDFEGQEYVCVFARDITERKRIEEAMRQSEAKFRNIVESSPMGMHMYELQPDGRLIFVGANSAADKILGLDNGQFVGKTIEEAFPSSLRTEIPEKYRAAARDGTPFTWEEVPFRDDRVQGTFEVHAFQTSPGRAAAMFTDITERRQAEEKFHRMEAQSAHVARLSTLGELVAGIAHEVSQPLYCVVNYAKATRNVLTAEGEPSLKDLREWNEEIALAAHRAGEIITRLRNFARRREMRRARVSIGEVVRESVDLVAFEARRRGVAVRFDLSEEASLADVDRVQIQQVLVNLLRNAYEALEGVPAGERDLAVRTAVVDHCVEISVADNGPGLPGDGLKILDAFVTTKPDGLGMGLAISRTIVEAHGGRLWATPNRHRGTTFHFTVPVARERPSDGGQADGLRR